MQARLPLGLTVVLAFGCGSGKFVPVSGKVTLNGKPLANATVAFQPVGGANPLETGPGSAGRTNENGEYTLTTGKGAKGAVVGKHQVLISAPETYDEEDEQRARQGGRPQVDKVPNRYGLKGRDAITFVVPPEGTDQANFALKSP